MTIKHWQVGGAVRDRLLGVRSKDIDYAVEAPSFDAMLAWIEGRCEKVYFTKPEFVTVRARFQGDDVDFVLCRKDGEYGDGRRPDSVTPGSLFDDLARRDFTVNAIAFDEATGEFVDPFDGRGDLGRNRLRCVGHARDRFSEDALRLLRAIRFHITRGFVLDVTVLDCLHSSRLTQLLAENVSTERKREELQRCFSHSTPTTLATLAQFPLLSQACFGDGRIRLLPTQREI